MYLPRHSVVLSGNLSSKFQLKLFLIRIWAIQLTLINKPMLYLRIKMGI